MDIQNILLNIIFFLSIFFIIFLADFYILSKEKGKKRKIEKLTSQDMYIIKKFNLNEQLLSLRKLNFHISIINAFIIAFVSTFVSITNFHIGIQMAISFVLLFSLIYSIYEIYGRHMKKKYGKNNE